MTNNDIISLKTRTY